MPGPINSVGKSLLKKALASIESSAAKPLIGTKYKEKVIKRITKGDGDWRYIVFGDDEVEAVNKSVINSLARKEGTDQAMTKFASGTSESKLAQAYRALEARKVNASEDKKAVLDYFNKYTEQLKGTTNIVPKTSLVELEGRYFSMPKEYADLLNSEGALKILKDMK